MGRIRRQKKINPPNVAAIERCVEGLMASAQGLLAVVPPPSPVPGAAAGPAVVADPAAGAAAVAAVVADPAAGPAK